MTQLLELKDQWTKYGQEHVFRFADSLSPTDLNELIEQAKETDLDELKRSYDNAIASCKNITEKNIQPFPGVVRSGKDKEQSAAWRRKGLEEIADGQVACVLLAGGQGTRLSATDPKGMYDILLPSGKTLFQLQAERIRKVKELAAKETSKDPKEVSLRWYILTSKATHKSTVAFFESKNFFGLEKSSVYFFSQGNLPCVTPEGKIILESASVIAEAPNGNGGIYAALHSSGALSDMESRGVRTIFCYGVDNILVRVADPVFVGSFVSGGYDCGAKVVPKAYPDEAVGVLCLSEGKPMVMEYSEIGTERARKTDEHGNLVYNQGNICIHIYSLDFLKKIGKTARTPVKGEGEVVLPYHIALKKIPAANEKGEKETPLNNNGWKLETFIFDAFPFCSKMLAFEVVRDEEFSPLKNATGNDSPDSCRTLITKASRRYIEEAGGKFEEKKEGTGEASKWVAVSEVVEISPLVSYAGEGLEERVKGKTFKIPLHLD